MNTNHQTIYLDHNATTRPADEVVDAMTDVAQHHWANPSSVHRLGQDARRVVDQARKNVADLIGATAPEIVFTAGGTEAANLAIRGTLSRLHDRHVMITSTVEHSCVREPLEKLELSGHTVLSLPVDRHGLIDPDDLQRAMNAHAGKVALITIIWANNETGVVQPIDALFDVARQADPRVVFYTDAVQCAGKRPINVHDTPVDLLSISGHKFHGPMGIGALYVRRGLRLDPLVTGGPQERHRRGGTENVPAIAGLGVAAQLAARLFTDPDNDEIKVIRALRDRLEDAILATIPDTIVNGAAHPDQRLPNTTNIGFHRVQAEALLMLLSERGVCVSAGAACSSGSLDPSPVILAMGVEPEYAHGSIRFSLGHDLTEAQIDRTVEIVDQCIARLRRVLPV